jgi:HEAT repeat protein
MMLLALLSLLAQEASIDRALQQLGDESPEVRDQASAWIYGRGEEAVPALRKALAGAEPEVRARVATLLHRIDWEPLVPVSLLARLPEARAAFRRGDHAGFLEVLRDRAGWEHGGSEEVETYAIRLLRSPELALRKSALEILALMTKERGRVIRRPVGALVDLLCRWNPKDWEDEEGFTLSAIADLIHQRASPRDRRTLVEAKAEDPQAGRMLRILRAGVGDEASTPELLEALASETSPWPYLALLSAEKSGCRAAGPAVAKLLDSPTLGWMSWKAMEKVYDPSLSAQVLEASRRIRPEIRGLDQLRILVSIGSPQALGIVRESLTVGDMRDWAGKLLADAGDRSGFDLLMGEIPKKGGASCAGIASRMADGKSVDRLLGLLDSPTPQERYPVAQAVMYLSDPEARRKALLRFEKERDPEVRRLLLDSMESWSVDLGEPIEKVARDVGDPLAPTAAAILVRDRGAPALPLVETLLERGVSFPTRLIGPLLKHAPPRLLVRVGQDPQAQATYPVLLRLEELGAKAEVARLLSVPGWQTVAATVLLRMGGDASGYLKENPDDLFWGWLDDAAERDVPGIRELLRGLMQAGRIEGESLRALRNWALPEMLPRLRAKLGEYDASRGPAAGDPEPPEFCAMTLPGRNWGYDTLSAMAATGDPSVLPILLQRLNDPEPGMQAIAMRALARGKSKEAVPILRQIVISGRSWVRGKALFALAEIGAPGTEPFLKAQLRDNPGSGPAALARMGVDARVEIRALLDEGAPPGPVLGAIDLLANPEVYKAIDTRLPVQGSIGVEPLEGMIERITGRPCRITALARARGPLGGAGETLREILETIEAAEPVTHIFRDGTIVICTVDEAR